jgi:hypothetical protein
MVKDLLKNHFLRTSFRGFENGFLSTLRGWRADNLRLKTKQRSSLHLLESESRSRRSSEGRLLGMESNTGARNVGPRKAEANLNPFDVTTTRGDVQGMPHGTESVRSSFATGRGVAGSRGNVDDVFAASGSERMNAVTDFHTPSMRREPRDSLFSRNAYSESLYTVSRQDGSGRFSSGVRSQSGNPRASAVEKRELRWRDDTADMHSSFLDSADKGIAKSGMQQSRLTASDARSSGISRAKESQQAVKAGAAALQSKTENPFDIPLLTKRRAAPLETATPIDVPRASNTERDASDGLRRFPDASILAPTMSDRRGAPRAEHINSAASVMIEDHSNVDSLNRSLSYPQSDAVRGTKYAGLYDGNLTSDSLYHSSPPDRRDRGMRLRREPHATVSGYRGRTQSSLQELRSVCVAIGNNATSMEGRQRVQGRRLQWIAHRRFER